MRVIEWFENYFVVTSQRMLLTSGLVTRKVAMMPLVKVTDMSFQRNFQGRLLGYGTFILESAGQDQALRIVDHLPYPEQLYLEVCGLIFPAQTNPCRHCDGQARWSATRTARRALSAPAVPGLRRRQRTPLHREQRRWRRLSAA